MRTSWRTGRGRSRRQRSHNSLARSDHCSGTWRPPRPTMDELQSSSETSPSTTTLRMSTLRTSRTSRSRSLSRSRSRGCSRSRSRCPTRHMRPTLRPTLRPRRSRRRSLSLSSICNLMRKRLPPCMRWKTRSWPGWH
jgi:hypothetical protein